MRQNKKYSYKMHILCFATIPIACHSRSFILRFSRPTSTEEQIRETFEKAGCPNIVAFKFFPKDHRMALAQMPSVEEAVIALIRMHNVQLSDSSHLRVSFSKSTIDPSIPVLSAKSRTSSRN